MTDSGYPFERDMMQYDVSKESSSNLIDVKRIVYRAIHSWYLILLTLLIAFITAWAINRYSTSIYSVKASILIKENEENVGAKLLYNNALVNPYRNFYNELYILKSLPLLISVVEELEFDKRYFREGEIKTTEIYDSDFPFSCKVIKGATKGLKINYIQLSKNDYSLNIYDSKGAIGESRTYYYGDTVSVNGTKLVIDNKNESDLSYLNK
ncbi:MAG: capsular biosynthesis protein, partial [Fulvivirga sp.]